MRETKYWFYQPIAGRWLPIPGHQELGALLYRKVGGYLIAKEK
jgi:hypothetical protein